MVATLALTGCALAHERQLPDAGPARTAECVGGPLFGAITYCIGCERAGCCLHFCQSDGTWSECSYVPNACTDASVSVGDSVGARDE